MKHTHRFHRVLALLLAMVMVIAMVPAGVFAAGTTIPGNPETVQIGSDAAALRENNFNKGWKFNLGDNANASNPNFDDSAWKAVDLPHDFSITQEFTSSGEAESGFLPGGTGWYRKSFVVSEYHEGKTFLLNFDGVYSDAYVYVNGNFVGEHHYGYTSFAFDISEHLICDGATQNVVAVKAVNSVPTSRWYSGSGIYRDVTLYALDAVHTDLNGITVTTPGIADNDGTANVVVDVVNDGAAQAEVSVTAAVYQYDEEVASASVAVVVPGRSSAEAELAPVVSDPALWSVDNPNLYKLVIELAVDGAVVDTAETEFGYRWFEFNTSGFFLNDEAVKLNGVCMHHDQGGLGSAAYYDAMYRQMSIMKDMGANAIRVTHNPADEDLIAICNELGLLVIEETFDGLVDAKNTNYNDFSKYFESDADAGLYGYKSGMTCAEYAARAIVKRDKNAPSIIAWSFGNEIQEGTYWNNVSRYDDICRNYISWVNDEDGTRPVTSGDNNRGSDNRLVDVLNVILESGGVVGFNYCNSASSLYNLAQRFGGVIIASETASATNSRGRYQSQASNTSIDGAYHLTSYDTSSVGWGITAHDSIYNTYQYDCVAGEFVWTGFDYIGEPTPWNGTSSGDNGRGAVPNSSYFGIVETTGFAKDTYYLYRAQWNKDATTVHLVTSWDNGNMMTDYSGKTPVWVYSNAAKVELYLNDELIGTTVRTPVTSAAGHTYYTYAASSNNSTVCTAANNTGADALYTIFNVAYTAGTLTAKAYDENGDEIALDDTMGQYTVSTPDAVTKLVASADTDEINANGTDLVYVEVDVTDANGNLDTMAANNITFTVEGPAVIAGVDNGDQATRDKYQQPSVLTSSTEANIDAYAGKALVILRATEEGGEITLTIASSGLEGQTVTVNAVGGSISADEGLVAYTMVRDYSIQTGTTPELGTAITGILADETTVEGAVAWNDIPASVIATAGDYTITGIASFEGYEAVRVSARLHVIPSVVSLRNVAAATMANTQPTLPGFVSGVLADGTLAGEFAVVWDAPDASVYANVGDIITVTGTAVVFGEETRDVTCTVRVAEAVNTESVNVAPMADSVTQDIPAGYESDNLMSINNGYKQFVDNTGERWTNWNYRTHREDATLTLTWATAQMVSHVNLYYYYDNCCAYPEAIEFSYSLDNQSYQVIGHTAELVESAGLGALYTYTFDQPINPVGLKVKLTQQGGTSGAHCVGLIEMEVMSYAASLENQTSAALSAIKVDGTAIEGFDPAVYAYEVADGAITAEAAENVGITILPKHKGYVRILTVSEDGASANTYELAIAGEVCYHENLETLPAVEATCTKSGLTEGKKCADCGEIVTAQEEVPALGHDEQTVPAVEATFDNTGLSEGVACARCGAVLVQQEETPVLDYNEGIVPLEVLIPTAGDWQTGYEATEGPANLAMDDNLNTIWHTDWYGTSRENHWIQFELTDSYNVDGLRYKPRISGNTNGIITEYDIQVSNDGETFTSVASGNWEGDRNWKVVEFDAQNVKYVRLVAVDALTDNSYVFACAAEIRLTGEKSGEAPHEHAFGEWTTTTKPTCTEAGVETRTCECGETETREIAALGHTEEVLAAVEPTCTETGLTEGKKCSVCDEILVAQEVVEALGHDYVNGDCSRCDAVLEATFEDVPVGSFFFDSVEWAVEQGITNGASATTFNPNGELLRGQVVVMLWRAAGQPEPETAVNPFTDVTEKDFFYKAVLWAVEKGITTGATETTFNPYGITNRAQAVTFLWRYLDKPESDATNDFSDVVEGMWYEAPINWAVENGITNGMGDGTFGITSNCNRAQMVTFLYRALAK